MPDIRQQNYQDISRIYQEKSRFLFFFVKKLLLFN